MSPPEIATIAEKESGAAFEASMLSSVTSVVGGVVSCMRCRSRAPVPTSPLVVRDDRLEGSFAPPHEQFLCHRP